MRATRKLTSEDVLERLSDLFVRKGVPDHIRSDNGSEFTAKCVREWLGRVGVKTLFIEPGSPWENGYVESFNGRLRDELLDRIVETPAGMINAIGLQGIGVDRFTIRQGQPSSARVESTYSIELSGSSWATRTEARA